MFNIRIDINLQLAVIDSRLVVVGNKAFQDPLASPCTFCIYTSLAYFLLDLDQAVVRPGDGFE